MDNRLSLEGIVTGMIIKHEPPKILYWDVEVALKVGYFYNQWNTNIPHTHIKHHSFLLSVAWMWESDQKIHSVSLLDDKRRFKHNFRDDTFVVKTMRDEINKADAIVAHNGDKFDTKELNGRLAKHGLKPTNNPIQLDTLKMAKAHFRYSGGNSLANLCEYHDLDAVKGSCSIDTWIAAAEGDANAIEEVRIYNMGDIPPLRELYLIQRPFAPAKLNQNLFTVDDVCPACGTKSWKKNGTLTEALEDTLVHRTRITARQKWSCKGCGYSIIDKHTMKSVRLR